MAPLMLIKIVNKLGIQIIDNKTGSISDFIQFKRDFD